MSDVSVITAGADGWPRVRWIDEVAFGYTWPETGAEIHQKVLELDRTLLAVMGGEDVGIASTFSLSMSLPGASACPVAGLTWVGVLPTHRRRGVLNALMRHHLDELHEQTGEPIAALFAAEPAIYGRYGYGLGSQRLKVSVPREFARLMTPPTPDEPAALLVSADDVRPQLALVADAVAHGRPGVPTRTPLWWDRTLDDPPSERSGSSALRTLLVADDSGPRGFALYSTKEEWDDRGAQGTLAVRELMAVDAQARRALWRVLLGTDLMKEVSYWNLPIDDPILLELADLRRALPTVVDALFVRVVDIARGLSARTYAVDIDVVLEVEDTFCPWNTGRWRLTGGPDGAACSPTTEAADLTLDARELGAIYLGGTSLRMLADAGFVTEHRTGAIDATTRAFASARAPWCPFIF